MKKLKIFIILIIILILLFSIIYIVNSKKSTTYNNEITTYDFPNISISGNMVTPVIDIGSPPSYKLNLNTRIVNREEYNYSWGNGSSTDYSKYKISSENLRNIVNLLETMYINKTNGVHEYTREECINYAKENLNEFSTYYSINYKDTNYYTIFPEETKIIYENIENRKDDNNGI